MRQIQRFDLTLRVTASRLPVILQTVDGECELVKVVPASIEPTDAPHTRQHSYVNGNARKGITGQDLALSLLAGGRETEYTKIVAGFEARGFASNSASPVMSKLVAAGKVSMLSKGIYRLNPAGAS